jgi:hypothetical protein
MSLTPHLVISPGGAVPVVKGWGFELPPGGCACETHIPTWCDDGSLQPPTQFLCLGNCKLEILGSPRLFDRVGSSCAIRTVTTIISRQPSFRKSGGVGLWYEAIRYMVAHGRSCWCFREANDWRCCYFETGVVFDGFIQPFDELQITCCIP